MKNETTTPRSTEQELLAALLLAIRALNRPVNFDTGIADPNNPNRTLSSYKLIPMLEHVARRSQSADDSRQRGS